MSEAPCPAERSLRARHRSNPSSPPRDTACISRAKVTSFARGLKQQLGWPLKVPQATFSQLTNLAECAEQRKIQPRSHRLRSQRPCERDIGVQLRLVALHLLREKGLAAAAFVATSREGNHPARPVAIPDKAVDH